MSGDADRGLVIAPFRHDHSIADAPRTDEFLVVAIDDQRAG